jgi:hypothetical protein
MVKLNTKTMVYMIIVIVNILLLLMRIMTDQTGPTPPPAAAGSGSTSPPMFVQEKVFTKTHNEANLVRTPIQTSQDVINPDTNPADRLNKKQSVHSKRGNVLKTASMYVHSAMTH